jgi:hypothetical protein
VTTKLDKPLRREIVIGREPWVITITPAGLKLVRRGRRKGVELEWKALVSGEAALAVALNASLREIGKTRSGRTR